MSSANYQQPEGFSLSPPTTSIIKLVPQVWDQFKPTWELIATQKVSRKQTCAFGRAYLREILWAKLFVIRI